MKPGNKGTQKPPKGTTPAGKEPAGLTDEERAAIREHVQELKAEKRRGSRTGTADGENDVLAKIAALPQPDRAMAERIHAIIEGQRARTLAENLVRNARLCQGRQGGLLLPKCTEIQNEIRYARLQR